MAPKSFPVTSQKKPSLSAKNAWWAPLQEQKFYREILSRRNYLGPKTIFSTKKRSSSPVAILAQCRFISTKFLGPNFALILYSIIFRLYIPVYSKHAIRSRVQGVAWPTVAPACATERRTGGRTRGTAFWSRYLLEHQLPKSGRGCTWSTSTTPPNTLMNYSWDPCHARPDTALRGQRHRAVHAAPLECSTLCYRT